MFAGMLAGSSEVKKNSRLMGVIISILTD